MFKKLIAYFRLEEELSETAVVVGRIEGQQESRWWTLLWKGMIVYLLTAGNIGCILSALGTQYDALVLQGVTLAAALFLVSLYYRKMWENIGYCLFFCVMAFAGFAGQEYIRSGFYRVMNDLMEEGAAYFDSNAMRSYGETVNNGTLSVTISMAYISVVVCLITNILISRKMRYRLLLVLGSIGIMIPLYLQKEPALFYVFQWFAGLVVAVVARKNHHCELQHSNNRYVEKQEVVTYVHASCVNFQVTAICVLITACVVIGMAIFVPVKNYHKVHSDSVWKKSTADTMENIYVFGMAGLFNRYTSTGGLRSGKLGGVNSVRLDYETDLRLTFVPTSERTFYLREFVGQTYLYGQNYWTGTEQIIDYNANEAALAYLRRISDYIGRGLAEVENVDAMSAVYLPYYSFDYNKMVVPGHKQSYAYYTSGDNFASTPVTMEENTKEWLAIPEENKEEIAAFAKEAGLSGTPEQIVQQLGTYYQEHIPYSYSPGATPRGKDFVEYFLKENRKGYCAHFASAAVLLFRYMGIPARYAEGYAVSPADFVENGKVLPDKKVEEYYSGYCELEQTGVMQVDITDADAHAWVEIYCDTKGWQIVDITPQSSGGEMPLRSVWSQFMGLFRGNRARNNTASADRMDVSGITEGIKDTTTVLSKTVLFVFVLLGTMGGLWWAIRRLNQIYIYRRGSTNDRIIWEYKRYLSRKGRKLKKLQEAVNYEQQLMLLQEAGILVSEEDKEKMRGILEQAGFGCQNVSQTDWQWLRQKWK